MDQQQSLAAAPSGSEGGGATMTRKGVSMLERTLDRFTREFGDPLCRGDCCWWTLSREGRKPVRVSIFIDPEQDGSRAVGWMCDLQAPASEVYHFDIGEEQEIEPLIAQVREMLRPLAPATEGRGDGQASIAPAPIESKPAAAPHAAPVIPRGGTG
jgi:hypothetical protein